MLAKQKTKQNMQRILLAWTRAVTNLPDTRTKIFSSGFFILLVVFSLVLLSISIYAGRASAIANDDINFQARVLTNTGALVPDGVYSVEFNIYAQASGGVTQWTETQNITTKNGYITASLGSVTPFGASVDWSEEQWLSMNINADGEMSPRMRITAVPLALQAVKADALTTAAGTITADNLAQLGQGAVQDVSSATDVLRLNQTGSGGLLQLQAAGLDILTVSNAGDLATARGVTLGTSTLSTSGTIRWSGTDFEGYDGSGWVSLTNNGDVGTFYAYDNAGGLALTTTWADLSLNVQTKVDSQYTHTSGTAPVTIQEDGWYEITYNVSTDSTSGSDRTTSRAKLQLDSGGGYADIPGSFGYMYNRQATEGEDTVSRTIVHSFSTGDIIKLQADILSGSNVSTIAGGTSLGIKQISASTGGGGGGGSSFEHGGNAFGGTALLGTSDNYDLDILTNGVARLTVDNTGSVLINNDLTVGTGLVITGGGADITGNATIDGTLAGLTGLTVDSGGLLVTAGGADITGNVDIDGVLDLNSNGITNAGNITGVGSALTASGGLVISSSAGADLELSSASGTIVLGADTLQRVAAGTTTLELNDSANTLFSITNTDGAAVAGLSVEGQISAQGFSGSGSLLTALNASNLTTGTVGDSLLSINVAKLNTAQTFTALQTLNAGLTVGNTASTASGTIRFNGIDFEGYDGSQWLSLTGGAGASSDPAIVAHGKIAANGTNLNATGASVVRNSVGNYTVTLDTALADTNYTIQLTVEEPSATQDDIIINPDSQATAGFDVNITEQDNSTAAGTLIDKDWYFTVIDDSGAGGGGGGGTSFDQGGNDFNATAILGTTDADALELVTNGVTRLTISATGAIVANEDFTAEGDLTVDLNTFLNGNITLGDAASDVLTLNSDSLALNNGLNIDNGTLMIDSANNRIGINNASPSNTLAINTPATNDSAAEVLIYTGGVNQKGLVLQTANGQVANAFEVQDSNGDNLAAISASGSLVLGNDTASPSAGVLVLNDALGSNGFTGVLGISNLSANRSIALPDADGTVCLSGSTACGFVLIAQGSAQVDSGANNSIFINKTNGSGNLVLLQRGGTDVFTVGNNGALTLSLDSTDALRILDSGSNPIFTVDTISKIIFAENLNVNKISGAGLTDCTNSNQALQWDSTSENFSCIDLDIGTTLAHVVDSAGGTDVNTSGGNALPWGSQTRVDTGLTHDTATNNSRVTMDGIGWYRINYSVIIANGGNGRINAKCQVRLNGASIILPSSSYSYIRNSTDNGGSNTGEALVQTSSANEYYEVVCSQNGSNGSANTVAGASWTSVEKL